MTIMGSNHMNEHFRRNTVEAKYARYSKNPYAFINENRTILNTGTFRDENVPLEDFELDALQHMHKNQNSVICKSRQMHTTTLAAAYCFWNMVFKINFNILVVSHDRSCARRFIQIVRKMIDNYSSEFFNGEDEYVINNQRKIQLKNGNMLESRGPGADAGKGCVLDLLILDEAAFIKDVEHIWMGAGMALSQIGGKCIMYSTPNWAGDFFYNVWASAAKEENDFKPMTLHWSVNPKFNKDMSMKNGKMTSPWYDEQCKILNNDESLICQELDAKFAIIKKSPPKRINFRLDGEIYDEMTKELKLHGWNISEYIRDLIKKDLGL